MEKGGIINLLGTGIDIQVEQLYIRLWLYRSGEILRAHVEICKCRTERGVDNCLTDWSNI